MICPSHSRFILSIKLFSFLNQWNHVHISNLLSWRGRTWKPFIHCSDRWNRIQALFIDSLLEPMEPCSCKQHAESTGSDQLENHSFVAWTGGTSSKYAPSIRFLNQWNNILASNLLSRWVISTWKPFARCLDRWNLVWVRSIHSLLKPMKLHSCKQPDESTEVNRLKPSDQHGKSIHTFWELTLPWQR